MIGLVANSRQVFDYLDPILIYISLWIDCLFENCSMFHLAFVAGSLQGHWWGFISRNYVVWPIFFLTNVFIALKGTHSFIFISISFSCINIRFLNIFINNLNSTDTCSLLINTWHDRHLLDWWPGNGCAWKPSTSDRRAVRCCPFFYDKLM